jgi:hypothetical protein
LNENSENEIENVGNVEIKSEEECFEKASKNKNKRKKYKKRKKQLKSQETQKLSEQQKIEDHENLDEIEKAVQQINKLLGEPTPSISLNSSNNSEMYLAIKSKEQILMVEHKHLNAYKLKRIFNSTNIEDRYVLVKVQFIYYILFIIL